MSDVFVLRLTTEETRLVYAALLKMPYEQVATTVETVARQVREQEAAMEAKRQKRVR